MKKNKTRRSFIGQVINISSGIVLIPSITSAKTLVEPPLDAKVVNEYVKVAHSDLNRVKELLAEFPHLLNAAWDWGDGDFETAIGAAGHMGLTETANYLIDLGARFDIFVMTMLGKTTLVKSILEEYPVLLDSSGPHGFTLLHHAQKGGEAGEELYHYLQTKGLTETHKKVFKK